MSNNGHSNLVTFPHLDLPQWRLRQSARAASRPIKATQIGETDEQYRYRMFASVLVAGLVGMLVITGQWMFTILARMP